MSMNGRVATKKVDRRVRRTRDRLGDALVDLLQEKPFATITVQQVLDRAGVGRSTFYTHYRGKEDLFLSDCDEFFEAMATALSRRRDPSERVAPGRAALAHALAGALVSLLSWWIDHDAAGSPAAMDELYHRLVWNGLSGADGPPAAR